MFRLGSDALTPTLFAGIDWTSDARVHSDPRNLVIHAFAVPLFVGSFALLITFLARGDYLPAAVAVVFALAAMVLQATGHALEPIEPTPFSGPGNILKRWFAEQFIIFPLFFLTRRWWRQFHAFGDANDHAG